MVQIHIILSIFFNSFGHTFFVVNFLGPDSDHVIRKTFNTLRIIKPNALIIFLKKFPVRPPSFCMVEPTKSDQDQETEEHEGLHSESKARETLHVPPPNLEVNQR
jgi:hypothetical protein